MITDFTFGVFQIVQKKLTFIRFMQHQYNQILISTKPLDKNKILPEQYEFQIEKQNLQISQINQVISVQLVNQIQLPFHQLTNLTSLCLLNSSIEFDCFLSLQHCEKLKVIQVINCSKIQDFSLLINLKDLQHVFIVSDQQIVLPQNNFENLIVVVSNQVQICSIELEFSEDLPFTKKKIMLKNQPIKVLEKTKSYFDLFWQQDKPKQNPLHSKLQIVDRVGTMLESSSYSIEELTTQQQNCQEQQNDDIQMQLQEILNNQWKIIKFQEQNSTKLDKIKFQVDSILKLLNK